MHSDVKTIVKFHTKMFYRIYWEASLLQRYLHVKSLQCLRDRSLVLWKSQFLRYNWKWRACDTRWFEC